MARDVSAPVARVVSVVTAVETIATVAASAARPVVMAVSNVVLETVRGVTRAAAAPAAGEEPAAIDVRTVLAEAYLAFTPVVAARDAFALTSEVLAPTSEVWALA